jgi:hypothetical protein
MNIFHLLERVEECVQGADKAAQENAQLAGDHLRRAVTNAVQETLAQEAPSVLHALLANSGAGGAAAAAVAAAGRATGGHHHGGAGTNSSGTLPGAAAVGGLAPSLRPIDHGDLFDGTTRGPRRGVDGAAAGGSGATGAGGGGAGAAASYLPERVRTRLQDSVGSLVTAEITRLTQIVLADCRSVAEWVVLMSGALSRAAEELTRLQADERVVRQQGRADHAKIDELQSELERVARAAREGEAQMDILRGQVSRRDRVIDAARAEFRREVARFRSCVHEMDAELSRTRHALNLATQQQHLVMSSVAALGPGAHSLGTHHHQLPAGSGAAKAAVEALTAAGGSLGPGGTVKYPPSSAATYLASLQVTVSPVLAVHNADIDTEGGMNNASSVLFGPGGAVGGDLPDALASTTAGLTPSRGLTSPATGAVLPPAAFQTIAGGATQWSQLPAIASAVPTTQLEARLQAELRDTKLMYMREKHKIVAEASAKILERDQEIHRLRRKIAEGPRPPLISLSQVGGDGQALLPPEYDRPSGGGAGSAGEKNTAADAFMAGIANVR